MMVKDIMNKDFVVVNPHITAQEAAEKMVEAKTKCLIVVEKKKLSGILTDWDFVKLVADSSDSEKIKIKEIMTSDVVVVTPDISIEEAAQLMFDNNIKKLPVVSGNVLIGIVSAMEIIMAEPKLIEQIGALINLSKKPQPVAG